MAKHRWLSTCTVLLMLPEEIIAQMTITYDVFLFFQGNWQTSKKSYKASVLVDLKSINLQNWLT